MDTNILNKLAVDDALIASVRGYSMVVTYVSHTNDKFIVARNGETISLPYGDITIPPSLIVKINDIPAAEKRRLALEEELVKKRAARDIRRLQHEAVIAKMKESKKLKEVKMNEAAKIQELHNKVAEAEALVAKAESCLLESVYNEALDAVEDLVVLVTAGKLADE